MKALSSNDAMYIKFREGAMIMKIFLFLILFVQILLSKHLEVKIDTLRFTLKQSRTNFQLIDNQMHKTLIIQKNFIIDPREERREQDWYVSSFDFSEKTNSFEIGNGLIGIQISSYSYILRASAQPGAGRDIFLIYDPTNFEIKNKLEFGITKRRVREMGCLSALTAHFILSDINNDGKIDIGYIKEQINCYGINGFFKQDSVKWLLFQKDNWQISSYNNLPENYIELPLIELNLNPIDVFGFKRWGSYDPKEWGEKDEVKYYPSYRIKLIKNQKENGK